MTKRFKCVLFDLDGTLLSTGGAGFCVIAAATGGTSSETLKRHNPDFFLPNFENAEEFEWALTCVLKA